MNITPTRIDCIQITILNREYIAKIYKVRRGIFTNEQLNILLLTHNRSWSNCVSTSIKSTLETYLKTKDGTYLNQISLIDLVSSDSCIPFIFFDDFFMYCN